ncbi:hypothetical protein O4J56_10530 [Nocardiopsis sp. RSe5-2]|uniref:Uncharacterized protein n=1 Tax=Nocardiopsis endophytica TaxID=3018445 RepID=A0ABT4U2A5_9ACTN|nr:hypothetical protein [Nocardiopsis endophytica]MDA2811072.1 hypothetical protein [Nocardiopsis endophytica]
MAVVDGGDQREGRGVRWVWRGEQGGFKIEYGALFLLVATIVTAVMAFGLPTRTQELYINALCAIDPDRDDCGTSAAPPDDGQGGDGSGGGQDGAEDGDGAGEDEDSGDGTEENEDGEDADGAEDEDAGDEESEEEGKTVEVYSQKDGEALLDAYEELTAAEAEMDAAESDDAYDLLMEILLDIVGYTDAKKCLTEGDIIACLSSVLGFTAIGKLYKLGKNSKKIYNLWQRYRKSKKAKSAAKSRLDDARQAVDDVKKRADDNKVTRTCPVPSRGFVWTPASGAVVDGGPVLRPLGTDGALTGTGPGAATGPATGIEDGFYTGEPDVVIPVKKDLQDNINLLGGDWTARRDTFPMGKNVDFEIHVYYKGKEVGVYGSNGWFNKHRHRGVPDVPDAVENRLKGIAVDTMRKTGRLKEGDSVKGDDWKRNRLGGGC